MIALQPVAKIRTGFLSKLSPTGADKDDLFESSDDRRADSRLSCQILLTDLLDGLVITVAEGD